MTAPTPATVAALQADNVRLRTEALRAAAVTAHDLPDDLAAFLTGTTEDDLSRQASALARLRASADAEPPPPGGGMPAKPRTVLVPNEPTPFDPQDIVARINARTY